MNAQLIIENIYYKSNIYYYNNNDAYKMFYVIINKLCIGKTSRSSKFDTINMFHK